MAFWNSEKITPEVIQTYGPYQDLSSQLNTSYDTSQNRAAQKINQIYASAGMSPTSAPASAAKARSTTDLENQRAQQQYQSYYDWLKGRQLYTPQTQASGLSTLLSPFVSGIGQAAGPGIVSAATKGLGNAWDWATTPSTSAGIYDSVPAGWGASTPMSGYGIGEEATSGLGGFDWGSFGAYGDVPSSFNLTPTDFFDSGFIGW